MPAIFIPKYNVYYRVNPRDNTELQWAKKLSGAGTSWQHAYGFNKPISGLDIDDETGCGVVVTEDKKAFVSTGVRSFGRKYYTAKDRIYALYCV